MSSARPIIVELLRNIGGRKEVEQYLKHYVEADSQKWALVALSHDVVDEGHDKVASALSFLMQVGLQPIVLHAAVGTFAETQRLNLSLMEALQQQGCAARPVGAGMFATNDEGVIVDVDLEPLSAADRAGQLPIVACLGQNPSDQLKSLDPLDAADALARRLEPYKLVVLTRRGGILDGQGAVISAINLAEDDTIVNAPWLHDEDRQRLERLTRLLEVLPSSSSVSITSPDHLARELFTHRGAGTLIQRGERVLTFDSFADVDRDRLRGLLESCFGRALTDTYFDDKRCERVYVTEAYRATAIVTREGGVPYLDKFAVTNQAQGEGLGGAVWKRLRRDHPRLFWRAQPHNPINNWYFSQADGCIKTPKWTVFWNGFDDFADAQKCVELALSLPPTLRAHGMPDE